MDTFAPKIGDVVRGERIVRGSSKSREVALVRAKEPPDATHRIELNILDCRDASLDGP